MAKIKVGIILPSGYIGLPVLKNPIEKQVTTVFGDTSIVECEIGDVPCAYVVRLGKSPDTKNPSEANYRAYVWALKESGCTHVIGVSHNGTLKDVSLGTIVILDDFYDRTTIREKCFHDGEFSSPKGAVIVPLIPTTFNQHVRQCVLNAAKECKIDVVPNGKAVVIDGDSFPTKMEATVYHKNYDADYINASICTEAILTKEAGMLFVGISIVSFDANAKSTWRHLQTALEDKKDAIQELIKTSVLTIGKENWDKDFTQLMREIAVDTDRSCKCRK